jgi:hypothetical protein
MNAKIKVLIIMGLKAMGNYDDALMYIEERLTSKDVEDVQNFFNWLKSNDLKIGHGNIDERWSKWKKSAK